MSQKIGLSLLFTGLLSCLIVDAQQNIPFSSIGIGSLQPGYFARARSMGGFSATLFDKEYINPGNPASFAAFYERTYASEIYEGVTKENDTLVRTAQVASLETGFFANRTIVQDASENSLSGNATLPFIGIGVPIPKFGGLSFGFIPYSSTSYHVTKTQLVDTSIGREGTIFLGEGNIHRFYAGVGGEYKGLAIGINYSYLFGNSTKSEVVWFPDQQNSFGTRKRTSIRAGGSFLEIGGIYNYQLSRSLKLSVGATYRGAKTVPATADTIIDRVVVFNDNQFSFLDSLSANENIASSIELPNRYTVGASIQKYHVDQLSKSRHYFVGVSYTMDNWGDVNSKLQNSSMINIGAEIIPGAKESNPGFLLRNMYRAGIKTGKAHYLINNEKVNDFGITFGIGIPVRQGQLSGNVISTIDFSFEFGSIGDVGINGLRENYFNFTLGMNLNEANWMVKRRFY